MIAHHSRKIAYKKLRLFGNYQQVISLVLHVHTSLFRDQDLILSIVDRLGRFEVSRTVCDTTTHVVCGNPRRTINILAATAMGCWVLSTDWVSVLYWLDASCQTLTLMES